jgi:hypothetical protein
MDATTMSQIGLSGGVISILSIAFAIFKYINHRTIRSRCCGVSGEMGIDVDTPKDTSSKLDLVKPVEVVPV